MYSTQKVVLRERNEGMVFQTVYVLHQTHWLFCVKPIIISSYFEYIIFLRLSLSSTIQWWSSFSLHLCLLFIINAGLKIQCFFYISDLSHLQFFLFILNIFSGIFLCCFLIRMGFFLNWVLLQLLYLVFNSLYLFSLSTVFLPFLYLFSPWWKLSEASPSATVLICTRLCPLLKVFLCCSTLWALSCLVFLLVTLLALTDSQVKCVLRAACICVSASSVSVCHSHSFGICFGFVWDREVYHETVLCLLTEKSKTS